MPSESFDSNPATASGYGHEVAVSASACFLSLDILRGIAILGALLISIWSFGGFSANKQLHLLLYPHGGGYLSYATIVLLVEGKMLSLVSLVFGAAMVIFFTNPGSKNQLPKADIFIGRQMWLIALGLLNALVFLWPGDLLFHLGIMGILLFPFVRLKPRALIIAALITVSIFCGKNYWNYSDTKKTYNKFLAVTALEKKLRLDSIKNAKNALVAEKRLTKKDTLSTKQKADKAAWKGILNRNKYDPKKDNAENTPMWATAYSKIWSRILPVAQSREAEWTYKTGIWDLAGMMLLGMGLFKLRFFSHRFRLKTYLLIALVTLTGGLLLAWFRLYYNQQTVADITRYIKRYWLPHDLFYPFEKVLMALGYASLVMALLQIRASGWLWKALSAVGRLALTNYLVQSIICTLLFTGYGMGYFGRLKQYELYMVVGEIWLVQLIFSVLWLRYFKYGPFEWLLRCASYRRWLTIKRYPVHANEPTLPAT